jgi:UDP-N-acetylmuramoyl-tripeptide--D-alanyl-D-alanine ligase
MIRGMDIKGYKKIVVDSRDVGVGDLFFALAGEKVDGHDFIKQAAERGASAAVVSQHVESHGLDLFYVDDTLQALQQQAKQTLKERSPRVVAVTGSVGKTTTRDFIATLLAENYRVDSSSGNQNGMIGVPLSILNADPQAEILILEMGIDRPEGLILLTDIAPPEVGVLMSVDFVHSEFFRDIDEIAAAKSKIFERPETRCAVINKDSHYCLRDSIKNVFFSLKDLSAHYFGCDDFKIFEDHELVFEELWNLPARYYQMNFLAAVAVARYFNLSMGAIVRGFSKLKLPDGRFEVIEKKGVTFVNDSYNACETSMTAALIHLPCPSLGGKRIAVLGEMGELGLVAEKCHYNVGKVALESVDEVLCLGEGCRPIYDLWKKENREVSLFHEKREVVRMLKGTVKSGDVVLLKGSNLNKLWEILREFN